MPDIRDSRFFLPAGCWHGNEKCECEVKADRIAFRPLEKEPTEWSRMDAANESYRIAKPIKRMDEEKQIYDVTEEFMQELTYFPFGTHDDLVDAANESYRIVKPIKRVDEEKQIYDLTEAFMQELSYFPYGTHDDLCDAMSRIYDMEPTAPLCLRPRARWGRRGGAQGLVAAPSEGARARVVRGRRGSLSRAAASSPPQR